MKLAIFDLDHTLLAGDSDVLWCDFLMREGVLERSEFEPRNRRMEADYKAGTVSPRDFCEFYVGTLAGRSPQQWAPLRQRYLREQILPRIPPAARALVARHQDSGDTVVMSSATNRFLTELTAQDLEIGHLIATECERDERGVFTGRVAGTLNMREGKVTRLHGWLAEQGRTLAHWAETLMYSDSINDLPLLELVRTPVVVDPDARLAAIAAERGWPVLRLHAQTP